MTLTVPFLVITVFTLLLYRVLVFTQMARMLDVLEIFLNYHGHTYLRLDGATPVTKRQVLVQYSVHVCLSSLPSPPLSLCFCKSYSTCTFCFSVFILTNCTIYSIRSIHVYTCTLILFIIIIVLFLTGSNGSVQQRSSSVLFHSLHS